MYYSLERVFSWRKDMVQVRSQSIGFEVAGAGTGLHHPHGENSGIYNFKREIQETEWPAGLPLKSESELGYAVLPSSLPPSVWIHNSSGGVMLLFSQGTFGNSWRHVCLSQLGGGFLRARAGCARDAATGPAEQRMAPTDRATPPQVVAVQRLKIPALILNTKSWTSRQSSRPKRVNFTAHKEKNDHASL